MQEGALIICSKNFVVILFISKVSSMYFSNICFYQVCSILSLKVWDSTDKNFFKVKWCHLKENIFFALIIAPFHNRFLEVFWSLAGNSFAALFNCKVMFLKWTIYRNVHVIFVCFFCLLLFFVFVFYFPFRWTE